MSMAAGAAPNDRLQVGDHALAGEPCELVRDALRRQWCEAIHHVEVQMRAIGVPAVTEKADYLALTDHVADLESKAIRLHVSVERVVSAADVLNDVVASCIGSGDASGQRTRGLVGQPIEEVGHSAVRHGVDRRPVVGVARELINRPDEAPALVVELYPVDRVALGGVERAVDRQDCAAMRVWNGATTDTRVLLSRPIRKAWCEILSEGGGVPPVLRFTT